MTYRKICCKLRPPLQKNHNCLKIPLSFIISIKSIMIINVLSSNGDLFMQVSLYMNVSNTNQSPSYSPILLDPLQPSTTTTNTTYKH